MRIISKNAFAHSAPLNNALAFEIYKINGHSCIRILGRLDKKNGEWIGYEVIDDLKALCDSTWASKVIDAGFKTTEQMMSHHYMEPENPMQNFAKNIFDNSFTVIELGYQNELKDLIMILADGKYLAVPTSDDTPTTTVEEVIEQLSSDQPFAIMQDNEVVWMGTKQFKESLAEFLDKSIYKLTFSTTPYTTYYGGAAQNWTGLIIII